MKRKKKLVMGFDWIGPSGVFLNGVDKKHLDLMIEDGANSEKFRKKFGNKYIDPDLHHGRLQPSVGRLGLLGHPHAKADPDEWKIEYVPTFLLTNDVTNNANLTDEYSDKNQPHKYCYNIEIYGDPINILGRGTNVHDKSFIEMIPEDVREDVRRKKCVIVISNIAEGNLAAGTHNPYQFFEYLYQDLDEFNIPPTNVFLIINDFFIQKTHDKIKNEILNIDTPSINLLPVCYYQDVYRSNLKSGIVGGDGNTLTKHLNRWKNSKDKIRDYYFLSYNRNPKEHRRIFCTLLYKNNLLDKMNYSIGHGHHEESDKGEWSHLKDTSWRDPIYFKWISNQLWFDLLSDYIELVKKLPIFCSDDHIDDMNKSIDYGIQVVDNHYKNSYIHIVTESAYWEKVMFFTEKTFKPIAYFQPFIMVGNPGMLKKLRELGYKTFSPFIDESYDLEENHELRMKMIIEEIRKLNSKTVNEIHEFYWNLSEILEHNFKTLFDKKWSITHTFIFETLWNHLDDKKVDSEFGINRNRALFYEE